MKASELREKTAQELKDLLLELRKEQFNLRMQSATGQLTQVHQFGLKRGDIARIKTILNEQSGEINE
ncbi:MAG: 50S ribosomal protein L29 [Cycloclasticus sp.]|jgi:large subunit ribosomal protein L29|nr:50S ribosomal protein L29 [Cycloclasticus sp.]|tara:strand:- start:1090 stop:1290 length:201 start_codon:yes stop_codon:yes gene_type:complete